MLPTDCFFRPITHFVPLGLEVKYPISKMNLDNAGVRQIPANHLENWVSQTIIYKNSISVSRGKCTSGHRLLFSVMIFRDPFYPHPLEIINSLSVNQVNIGSYHSLSPIRSHAIIWTKYIFLSTKMRLKISSAKRRPICPVAPFTNMV